MIASQTALTVTPEQKATLDGKVCFDSVAYCLALDEAITMDQYNAWGASNAAAIVNLVGTGDNLAAAADIGADNIVGIFRRTAQDGELMLSHVMLSLGGGLCIGTNNGCIGGTADWSVQVLSDLLDWPAEGGNPSVTGEEEAPDWARERHVYYRSVDDAAGTF